LTIEIEKLIGLPVEIGAAMGTSIAIAIDLTLVMDQEPLEHLTTELQLETVACPFRQLFEPANAVY